LKSSRGKSSDPIVSRMRFRACASLRKFATSPAFSESSVWSTSGASSSEMPNVSAKRYDLPQTMQWMGWEGVLRMVHTGNDFGGSFGVQS
jgi:hypothetical protein